MMTPREILDMYGKDTHSIEIKDSLARDWLIEQGYIEWYPPIFGSSRQYTITEKGKEYRDGSRS